MWPFLPEISSRARLFVSLITLKEWVCMNDEAGTTSGPVKTPEYHRGPFILVMICFKRLAETASLEVYHREKQKYWSRYFRKISEIIFTWNKSSQEEKTPSSLVTPEHNVEEQGGKMRPMDVKLLCLLQSGSFLWNWRAPLCTTHRK